MKFLLLVTVLFLAIVPFITPPAMAQSSAPSSQSIKKVEKKLQQTKKEKAQLTKKLKNIESELEQQRKKLIAVAKDIKLNEQNLVGLELSIRDKQEEQEQIASKLTDDKKSISDLILALERIRRIPPEAVLARPESPLKTAQSTMLLQSILPRVYKRAENLKTDLERLKTLITALEEDKAKALKISAKLQKDKKSLSSLLSKRESIYASTEKDIKKQKAELAQISSQAKNLKDLVRKIEEKQKAENKRRKAEKKKQASNQKTIPRSTPIPSAGAAQLPVSGTIVVNYGRTDEIGAVSQGIKIRTRTGALIVAPMGGVVDYAGKFKGYGKIVILKHQKGYHSLIAGLDKIDTVVGRALSAGEPIGKMSGSSSNEATQTLYYELRYKGHPVNPSKKISGLR